MYDVKYDAERPTLPSCMILNDTQRGQHHHMTRREANSAILCDVDYKTFSFSFLLFFFFSLKKKNLHHTEHTDNNGNIPHSDY